MTRSTKDTARYGRRFAALATIASSNDRIDCQHCGESNRISLDYCQHCGRPMPAPPRCPAR